MLLGLLGAQGLGHAGEESAAARTSQLDPVVVTGVRRTEAGPLPGLTISQDQIPGNIQSASRQDIRDSNALNLGDFMNSQLQSVSISDYAGNPFQMDVNYRGFTASPAIGTPEGLSVFFDGVRVNEPFGDVVNWDLIPLNAIERFDLFPGSNPLFGLNTLGGAISLRTRSGFTSSGLEASGLGGSWGRRQAQAAAGGHGEQLGGFAALSYFDEEGWRDNSPSRVRQAFLRGDWRGALGVVTATALLADNRLIGNGLVPDDLYRERRAAVFTSPDRTRNQLSQFTLGGAWDVSPALNLTMLLYRRASDRKGFNGDIYEGFEDFTLERDLARTGLRKVNPALPWCQLWNRNGGGTNDGTNQVLNGPVGVNCTYGTYDSQIPRNGGSPGVVGGPVSSPHDGTGPGVVDGTPIGLLSKATLTQTTRGAAMQASWNYPRQHFMVGAAVDSSRAGYELQQQLGLINAEHEVYADPANIDPIYRAAQVDIVGNRFRGTSTTLSAYLNDTWTPREGLHVTAAARYNRTHVDSRLRTRAAEGFARLDQIRNRNVVFPVYVVCPSQDPASCPDEPEAVVYDFNDYATAQTATREKFTYHSFNPQLGVNWLPSPTLNLFANLSRGARVPSVVELGCAFDSTPVPVYGGTAEEPVLLGTQPASLNGPTCNLPTTLSGDPYLPQIRASSGELGARGRLGNWRWNFSAYRTDLKDDIYFVGVADGRSYFDTIGRTRRVGVEFGLTGRVGPVDVRTAYSYVDATFGSTFHAVSPHNSSADFDQNSIPITELDGDVSGLPSATANANRGFGTYQMIRVDPGARLPGIPAHNFSATFTWHATRDWQLGLTVIARSLAYVRGNENNLHQAGGTDQEIGRYICQYNLCEQALVSNGRPFTVGGTTPGYAVWNFETEYTLLPGLTVFAQVNNLFDHDYTTAGRLGITPFSPSVNGAIGPSGWNYNSSEWQPTTYQGPAAPRGLWLGISYMVGAAR
jgi:outer membrane receptor protein involved in Fe transport